MLQVEHCLNRTPSITGLVMQWQKRSVVLCLGLILLSLGQISPAADEHQAQEIVDRVARLFSSKSSIATVEMQITTENWQRNLSMKIWSLGAENVLVRLDSPPEEAGTVTLKAGNNIWYYLPKAHRKMKAPPAMTMTSWMGSHFTLDDLVKESSLTSDYFIQTSFVGTRDEVAVYEYTLTPKPEAAVVWGKIILEIRQVDMMPTWQHYYDEDEKLVRELTFSEYQTMGERLIPTLLVMRPVDKPGEQTTIVYKDIAFDVPIGEETFSLHDLER